jgi:hypothetical protein
MIDVGGQEIMTADKVTLRLNALVGYRVVAARQAVTASDDARQALYREAQLALRASSVLGISMRSWPTRTRSHARSMSSSAFEPASWVWKLFRWVSATSSCRAK